MSGMAYTNNGQAMSCLQQGADLWKGYMHCLQAERIQLWYQLFHFWVQRRNQGIDLSIQIQEKKEGSPYFYRVPGWSSKAALSPIDSSDTGTAAKTAMGAKGLGACWSYYPLPWEISWHNSWKNIKTQLEKSAKEPGFPAENGKYTEYHKPKV